MYLICGQFELSHLLFFNLFFNYLIKKIELFKFKEKFEAWYNKQIKIVAVKIDWY